MTEFEQQVAEALKACARIIAKDDGCGENVEPEDGGCAGWVAEQLAPRVAAAIKAAADRALVAINISELPPVVVHIEAAALAALRAE